MLPQEPKPATLCAVEQQMLARALSFLTKLGYAISARIVVVESLGDVKIHGMAARNQTIYLPVYVFDRGTVYLASTLLEEHLHLTLELEDCSREFQTYLLDKVIAMGQQVLGVTL
jgi:hypothetical protein